MNTTTSHSHNEIDYSVIKDLFDSTCSDSAIGTEWSFHQLSPYIGKIKSSIAKFLIENFTDPNDIVYDPFCGAGTVPFEAWSLGRNVVANDLNRYAYVLTNAKLHPPKSLEDILKAIEKYSNLVNAEKKNVDLRNVPLWVRAFFNKETLRETIAWVRVLTEKENWFLLACILGILHHQRPGFLSFPSSHTVPYLRLKNFPQKEFPQLYEYRNVKERLIKKAKRAFKRIPNLDNEMKRVCYQDDASTLKLRNKVDVIISSPPCMRQLDYARDNRLRLWFLGVNDYKGLDLKISPKEQSFIQIITNCLIHWDKLLKTEGKCVLFLGDNYSKKYKQKLPEIIENIATKELGSYRLIFKHESIIPNNRRVRRNYFGNKTETILVLEKIF